MIEKIASALSSATVGALAREASVMSRASEAVAGPFARAGGVSGFLGNLSPEVENGRQLRYSLKLPHGAGTVAKVMHYGVQPLILGKNIVDVAHSAVDLKKISPDKLIAAGIEPDKAQGISSPGTYEATLMWPCNDGERQWNTMSDWTCR